MTQFFEHSPSSFDQDLSNWNVSNCLDMSSMFASATIYNEPMSNWDVSSCTNMESMFSNATDFSQDLTGWDISAVQSLAYMFQNTAVNYDFGDWDINATNADYMFENSGMTCENYSSTLIGWTNGQTGVGVPTGMSFVGQSGMEYGTNGAVARDYLVNTHSWTISGDVATGIECVQMASLDELKYDIAIYPNPAQDFITITSNSSVKDIEILSLDGKAVYTGSSMNNIDISNLISGLYIVKCTLENNEVFTKKIIKK